MTSPPESYKRLIASVYEPLLVEAKRLRDPSVLDPGRRLLTWFFELNRDLGGSAHETAVASLRRELDAVKEAAKASHIELKRSWTDAVAPDLALLELDREVGKALSENTEVRRNAAHDDPFGAEVDSILRTTRSDARSLGTSLRRVRIALLVTSVWVHVGLYTRIGLQCFLAFIGNHTLRMVLAVLIAGIGYSWVAGQAGKVLELFATHGWVMGLAVLVAIFKEYFISKRVRALRFRLERSLLAPVVAQTFRVRLVTILSDAKSRKAGSLQAGKSGEAA